MIAGDKVTEIFNTIYYFSKFFCCNNSKISNLSLMEHDKYQQYLLCNGFSNGFSCRVGQGACTNV